MKTRLLILFFILTGYCSGFAQIEKDSVRVHFRVSKTEYDPTFKRNQNSLDSIFRKITSDSLSGPKFRLMRVKVTGAASPEGSIKFNKFLSEKRADAIFKEFRRRGFLNDTSTFFTYLGRDWEGLRQEVEKDSAVPFKEDVSMLLSSITSSNTPDHPLATLKGLHNGLPYKYLLDNIFPKLRESTLIAEYEKLYPQINLPDIPLTEPNLTAQIEEQNFPIPYNRLGIVKDCRPFYIGIKTNLLLDALLIPNIGAELYLGKNWSLTADWMYGWWDHDRTHFYWRAYGGTVGARWWFGKKATEKPLTGHHIGMFAGVLTYDFELGHGGIMGGIPHGTLWDRCNFISGVEYGYSLPVARRLNIDFTIGFGYMGGKYLKYEPKYGFYIWQSTHKMRWIGPTKAEISLVWLLGCDNYNRKRGGLR